MFVIADPSNGLNITVSVIMRKAQMQFQLPFHETIPKAPANFTHASAYNVIYKKQGHP